MVAALGTSDDSEADGEGIRFLLERITFGRTIGGGVDGVGEESGETGCGVAAGLGTIDDSEAVSEKIRFGREGMRFREMTGGGVDGVGDVSTEAWLGTVKGDLRSPC